MQQDSTVQDRTGENRTGQERTEQNRTEQADRTDRTDHVWNTRQKEDATKTQNIEFATCPFDPKVKPEAKFVIVGVWLHFKFVLPEKRATGKCVAKLCGVHRHTENIIQADRHRVGRDYHAFSSVMSPRLPLSKSLKNLMYSRLTLAMS
jgi:hypothetical protein